MERRARSEPRAIVAETGKARETGFIERARGGDASSFSALVELYQARAIHTAYSLVGNFEDARDLAQEAFVKAYERLDGFQSASGFYTWFYRILVNTCKDFLRKKKVRRAVSFWLGREENEGGMDPVLNVPDRSENAQEALENRDLGRLVNEALEALPFRQKSVFTLRYLEGRSLDQISQILDISLGAVKAHLWHACRKMRSALEGVRDGSAGSP